MLTHYLVVVTYTLNKSQPIQMLPRVVHGATRNHPDRHLIETTSNRLVNKARE